MPLKSRYGTRPVIGVLAPAVLLAGCAQTPTGSTVQVMPGPGKSFEAFQRDIGTCKGFAEQQVAGQAEAINKRAVGAAVLATALGVGLGAAIGGGRGAGIGATSGALGGAGIGAQGSSIEQLGIQTQYDNAYSQCMFAKGNLVPGYAPPAVANLAPSVGQDAAMVRAVQAELGRLDYLKAPPDGAMGPRTSGAIREFERANGMPVDGMVSTRLLARLRSTGTPGSGPASETASAPVGSMPADATSVPPAAPGPAITSAPSTPVTAAAADTTTAPAAPPAPAAAASSGGELVGKATPVSSGWVDPPKHP